MSHTIPAVDVLPASDTRAAKDTRAASHRHLTWMAGDVAHQGDLIFVALSALPASAKPRADRQLAEGQTKGSRHVLVGGQPFNADAAEIQRLLKRDARLDVDARYIGPVFSGAAVVDHPEHAQQVFPDQVCTAVIYQRNLDAEEREQRVID